MRGATEARERERGSENEGEEGGCEHNEADTSMKYYLGGLMV